MVIPVERAGVKVAVSAGDSTNTYVRSAVCRVDCNPHNPGHIQHAFVIAGKLHYLTLRTEKFESRKMQRIQGAHGAGEWL